jgi:parvulin-like peptidyl-prolyl isomerase
MIRSIALGMILPALLLGTAARAQAPDLSDMDAVQRALPDGPVALVDGKPVTREDFLFLYQSQLARMTFSSGGKEIPESVRIKAGVSTLAELVQREIITQLGERQNLKVTQAEIDEAYGKQMKLLIKEFTSDTHTPTEAEILERSGQTREEGLRDIYKALMVEKATKALAEEKKLTITDQEAREFYDKNNARFQRPDTIHLKQIYARPGENPAAADEKAWAAAEKKIKDAEARFKVGESFEGVAKAMSDGKDKDNGGDMGPRPAQALPQVFVETSKSLNPGDTSAPFKSEYGWHIIRLVAREGEANVPFEEAKDFIKDRLLVVRRVAAVEEYCRPVMDDDERVQIFLQLRIPEEGAPGQDAAVTKTPAPAAAPAAKAEEKKPEENNSEGKKKKKRKKDE